MDCFVADERHLAGHDRHEQHVGVERQAGHVGHGIADRLRVHARFVLHRAVGLHHAGASDHAVCHRGRGVADVDLTDRDVVHAAVEIGGLGQAGDRVLG
jgi:hypothetical protein